MTWRSDCLGMFLGLSANRIPPNSYHGWSAGSRVPREFYAMFGVSSEVVAHSRTTTWRLAMAVMTWTQRNPSADYGNWWISHGYLMDISWLWMDMNGYLSILTSNLGDLYSYAIVMDVDGMFTGGRTDVSGIQCNVKICEVLSTIKIEDLTTTNEM